MPARTQLAFSVMVVSPHTHEETLPEDDILDITHIGMLATDTAAIFTLRCQSPKSNFFPFVYQLFVSLCLLLNGNYTQASGKLLLLSDSSSH